MATTSLVRRVTAAFVGLFWKQTPQGLSAVSSRGGWFPIIREAMTGDWQRNIEVRLDTVLTHPTVFACVTLIANDIAKMRLRLVALDADGIWAETENVAYSPVLRKPNRYQTRIKFIQLWMISRLVYGNTYVLKQRDNRGVVTGLYVLDPNRVKPLIAPDGAVYYQLGRDDLSNVPKDLEAVPASEIIHDVMYPLYHPLVGISPIHACGLAATLGLKIQSNSTKFFDNGAAPSGILTAPGAILQATADRLKAYWDENFAGDNTGKVAVVGDGLKYEPMMMKSVDAQLVEQWRESAQAVPTAYHVPAYKVGAAPPPAYNNIEALSQDYYSQALQEPIESIEALLDEGLELKKPYGTEFDLSDLLRMDTATLIAAESQALGSGLKSPNEGRKNLNLPPVKGGETPYLQQQNWPLRDLAEREMTPSNPTPPAAMPGQPPTPPEPPPPDTRGFNVAQFEARIHRKLYDDAA